MSCLNFSDKLFISMFDKKRRHFCPFNIPAQTKIVSFNAFDRIGFLNSTKFKSVYFEL